MTIVGAGVVGAATAYVLAKAGHRVTLLEALDAPARATSFANGAQLSYSYVEPLATPATLLKLPSLLLDRDSPLRLKLTGEWSQLAWLGRFLFSCTGQRVRRSTRALLALASMSRSELETACAVDSLHFDHATVGKLVIYASRRGLNAARKQIDFQRSLGCEQKILSTEECIEREPALRQYRSHMAGGVWTASEAVGDAHRLSCELVARVLAMGGEAHYLTRVAGFRRKLGGEVTALTTERGDELAVPGKLVLANGAAAATLAAALGMRLPICPIKGYSVTLPVTDASRAPAISITDLRRKTVYAPLPGHLRVAGMAELVGHDLRIDPKRIAQLVDCARETFPGACDFDADPAAWVGLRPATPTSLPIIGATPLPNVLLNVGHGALGFTLAMGSARLLERALAGRDEQPLSASFAYAV